MTKKPIMIDGVDVEECKTFYINASHPELKQCINPYCKDLCKENPNYYYKQLKRKEQECEQLKKSVRSNKDKRKKATERYLKLKEFTNKEFEKLEAENDELKHQIEDVDTLCSEKESLIDKHLQALTKIKEIAEKVLKECNNCDQFSCYGCPDENKDELAQQILQKCEVIK